MSSLTVDKRRLNPLHKMIGKNVRVLINDHDGAANWTGTVMDVLDHENFLILKNGETVKVSIFNIRSL